MGGQPHTSIYLITFLSNLLQYKCVRFIFVVMNDSILYNECNCIICTGECNTD